MSDRKIYIIKTNATIGEESFTVAAFDTEQAARDYLERLKRMGNDYYCIQVLPLNPDNLLTDDSFDYLD